MCAKQTKTKKTRTKKAPAEKPKVTRRTKKREATKKEVEERVEKAVERKEPIEAPAPVSTTPPVGTPPRPVVSVRHAGSMIEREARGYSWGELSEAGIEPHSARERKVPVDIRRRGTAKGNAERLKGWLQPGEAVVPSSVRKAGPSKKK